MSSTRVPPGARGSYPAPGLALTPGPVRNQALTVIAVPFVLIVVLAVVLATTGPDDGAPATDGLYGSGALPDWGSGTTDDGTSGDGTSGDGTDPDGTYEDGTYGDGTYDNDPYGDGTADETPTDDTTTDTATDDTATEDTTADGSGPEATVTAYFDAINNRDFAAAWELGGKNLDQDYDSFVAGFGTTQRDDVTVTGTSGDDVSVTVVAWETDGTQTTFEGTYTVSGGVITSADMREGN
ncbi:MULTISPECIES: hypothetical protein [Streptomyces]|uniref:Integral membrane protein n=1 Tax=Streptomyces rubrogriseus TaxID=194673 RepID=A0ABT4PBR9_9ACTN|nr:MULTISPECIES: hypothetical protein [Streptomyces]MBQ0954245.1 hypothetical protein [Streptomyces sp. RK76]MCW8120868.1 hypothetical protein [Streptomyces anthocyanicus]MCZ4638573.1 hypothetical protein [Streptomyces rubrogriseus]PSK51278.1 hypothetical protein B0E38_05091 [Streptomyces sp. 111WW2]WTE20295.1 hypothetical protein OH747_22785 [Streptomyces anthocyanicus]